VRRYCRNNNPTLRMRALICGVDATLARYVSITKCKMPNMRQNLHKFMPLLKRAPRKRKPSMDRLAHLKMSILLTECLITVGKSQQRWKVISVSAH
jgi:hypothetical protein